MEMGLNDIVLILIIVTVVLFMFRRNSARRQAQSVSRISRPTEAELVVELALERVKNKRRLRLRILAGILLIIGASILIYSSGILKFILPAYIWSGILILAGIVLLVYTLTK
jgi:hypothetical protein